MGASTGNGARSRRGRRNPGGPEAAPPRRGQFERITKGTAGHIEHMRQAAIYAEGAFAPKVKALAAMLWSIAERCEPCVEHYARRARALGATEAEAGEFLALAGTLGGCLGETWARKAFIAFTRTGDSHPCRPRRERS